MKSSLNPTVHILLSTYNGEKYLDEQIKSLVAQTYNNLVIHIRDDGSTDNTPLILTNWASKYKASINIKFEKNLGVVNSFISLLKNIQFNEQDLFAFCDQDDFWIENKIELAINAMHSDKNKIEYILYCSRLEFVDCNLNHLRYSIFPRNIGFNNAIVENIATGCTIVFGSKIREYILQANPKNMMMHDWWTYLVASTFGTVIYDTTPTIKYRQHNNSVTPQWEKNSSKIYMRIINFLKRLNKNKRPSIESLDQAKHFIQTYTHVSEEKIELVNELLRLRENGTLLKRIKYILNPKVSRSSRIENLLLKPIILFKLH